MAFSTNLVQGIILMTYDVFVSYSSKDKSIADGVVSTLEQNGIRCWYAPRDIKPSDDWGNAIANAIQEAKIFLMVFSEHANQSQHVLDELLYAIDVQAVILPFRIENLEPGGAMRLHLSSRHWLDAYDPSWEVHLTTLVKNIAGILETTLNEEKIQVPAKLARKRRPRKRRSLLPWIIVGTILAVAVAAVLLRGGNPLTLLSQAESTTPANTQLPAESTRVSPIDGMVQVYIPPGSFLMGSDLGVNERPVHMVELEGFWMDEHEVTNAQYAAFLNDPENQEEGHKPWLNTDDESIPLTLTGETWEPETYYEDRPVVDVTWYGARAYCEWAGRRLPTEAEWEKAARGGLKGKNYPWGDQNPVCQANLENGARFDDDLDCNNRGTAKVKSYSPNNYGLYDMAGNVWEWVNDRYFAYYYNISPEAQPPGPTIGLSRVLRGGGWFTDAYYARTAYRNWERPENSVNVIGFRCAASPE